MEEHIQNVIDLLKEAIETEDWELVSESVNQLENEEFEDFVDEDTGELISVDRNEVLLERDHEIQKEDIQTIIDSESTSIILHREDVNIADYATSIASIVSSFATIYLLISNN